MEAHNSLLAAPEIDVAMLILHELFRDTLADIYHHPTRLAKMVSILGKIFAGLFDTFNVKTKSNWIRRGAVVHAQRAGHQIEY